MSHRSILWFILLKFTTDNLLEKGKFYCMICTRSYYSSVHFTNPTFMEPTRFMASKSDAMSGGSRGGPPKISFCLCTQEFLMGGREESKILRIDPLTHDITNHTTLCGIIINCSNFWIFNNQHWNYHVLLQSSTD